MIKDWLREIKYAYQRVKYGYDERIKWEFDSYFNQFIPPLKEFCEYELRQKEIKYNSKREDVFKETLKRIHNWEIMDYLNQYARPNQVTDLWEYVGKHITWYWN